MKVKFDQNSPPRMTRRFSGIVRMTLFAEGTSTNLGPRVAANVAKRITWDAAEYATNFLKLEFEILAKDERNLLGIHFVTIPTNGIFPNLTISRSPVDDLTSAWFWLIATGDPAMSFTNQVIKAVGGDFDQQTLVTGGSTTAAGRAFMYGRLGVRAATADEVARANAGNFMLSAGENSVVKRP